MRSYQIRVERASEFGRSHVLVHPMIAIIVVDDDHNFVFRAALNQLVPIALLEEQSTKDQDVRGVHQGLAVGGNVAGKAVG